MFAQLFNNSWSKDINNYIDILTQFIAKKETIDKEKVYDEILTILMQYYGPQLIKNISNFLSLPLNSAKNQNQIVSDWNNLFKNNPKNSKHEIKAKDGIKKFMLENPLEIILG